MIPGKHEQPQVNSAMHVSKDVLPFFFFFLTNKQVALCAVKAERQKA